MRSSNAQIGKTVLKRLRELRKSSGEKGTAEFFDRKVRRSWLVETLGCKPEILSRNVKIRQFLREWDSSIGTANKRSPAQNQFGADGDTSEKSNIARIGKGRRAGASLDGKIRWDTVYDAAGNSRLVPVLYERNRIDENASNWFRYLVVAKGDEPQSVEQKLSIIRKFKKFIRKHKVSELKVFDATFVLWKNDMMARVGAARVNICLQTVHAYYQYLEKTGVLNFWVQIYDGDMLPAQFKAPFAFPITSKPTERRSKQGVVTKGWTTPYYQSEGSSPGRSTPTDSQVRTIHFKTRHQKHGIRNSILLSLAERTGGRISELLQIRLSQLPDPARLMEIIEKGLRFEVFVKRKRRQKPMPLVLDKYIIIRILKYIEQERADIARRFPKTAGKSDFLFLGDRGNDLTADSATHLVLELFLGVLENAGIHRLRSKFAIDKLETLITSALERGIDIGPTSNYVESALQIVAQEMGQSSVMSLRPYLPLVFGRKLMTTTTAVVEENEQRLLETERLLVDQDMRIDEQMEKLKKITALSEAGEMIAKGQKLAAAKRLEQAAAALRAAA
jgi:site-specific recombinase XerD